MNSSIRVADVRNDFFVLRLQEPTRIAVYYCEKKKNNNPTIDDSFVGSRIMVCGSLNICLSNCFTNQYFTVRGTELLRVYIVRPINTLTLDPVT